MHSRCRRSSSYTFEVAHVVLHGAAARHSVLPVPSRAILSSHRFPARIRRRTATHIFTARRFRWGVGEWQYSCSSRGINKLSMGGERGVKSGTEAGSKTLDQAGSADVGDAGQSPSTPQCRGADTPLTPRSDIWHPCWPRSQTRPALARTAVWGPCVILYSDRRASGCRCSDRSTAFLSGPPRECRRRFGRRASGAVRWRVTGSGSAAPAPDWCCRGIHKTARRHYCRAKSASTSSAADAVFAAVFAVASAVAVWPARCTVAVKRGACAGPSVRISHSGEA